MQVETRGEAKFWYCLLCRHEGVLVIGSVEERYAYNLPQCRTGVLRKAGRPQGLGRVNGPWAFLSSSALTDYS